MTIRIVDAFELKGKRVNITKVVRKPVSKKKPKEKESEEDTGYTPPQDSMDYLEVPREV